MAQQAKKTIKAKSATKKAAINKAKKVQTKVHISAVQVFVQHQLMMQSKFTGCQGNFRNQGEENQDQCNSISHVPSALPEILRPTQE
jgi:hypothetical protein